MRNPPSQLLLSKLEGNAFTIHSGWKVAENSPADILKLTALLRDSGSVTHRLLAAWGTVPLLLMRNIDWDRGPLVIIGFEDLMMWPLLPPGCRKADSRSRWNGLQRLALPFSWRFRFVRR